MNAKVKMKKIMNKYLFSSEIKLETLIKRMFDTMCIFENLVKWRPHVTITVYCTPNSKTPTVFVDLGQI